MTLLWCTVFLCRIPSFAQLWWPNILLLWEVCPLDNTPHVHGRYLIACSQGKSWLGQNCAFRPCRTLKPQQFSPRVGFQLSLAWFCCAMFKDFLLIPCAEKSEPVYPYKEGNADEKYTYLGGRPGRLWWTISLGNIIRDSFLSLETDFVPLSGYLAGWTVICLCPSKL